MSEYQSIIESASVEGRSIVNLRRDRQRDRLPYANRRILQFADLFSVLDREQTELIDLWHIEDNSPLTVAKRLSV